MKAPQSIECENARKLIDLAVTGDLIADEEALLNAHLVECKDCRRRMATRKALWQNYPVGVYPSRELLQKTLASVAKARKPRLRSILALRPSVASVAASVLIIVGALYAFGLLPFQRNGDQALVDRMIALQNKYPDHIVTMDIDRKTIQVTPKSVATPPVLPASGPWIDNSASPARRDGTIPVMFVH